MIFSIDVREKICKEYALFEEIIKLNSKLSLAMEDAKDEEVKGYLKDAMKAADAAFEKEKMVLRSTIKDFEKEYLQYIFKEENENYFNPYIREI